MRTEAPYNLISDVPALKEGSLDIGHELGNVSPAFPKLADGFANEVLLGRPQNGSAVRRPQRNGNRRPDVGLAKVGRKSGPLKHSATPSQRGQLNDKKTNRVGKYKHLETSITARIDFRVVPHVASMKALGADRRKPDLDAAGKDVAVLGEPFPFGWGKEWAVPPLSAQLTTTAALYANIAIDAIPIGSNDTADPYRIMFDIVADASASRSLIQPLLHVSQTTRTTASSDLLFHVFASGPMPHSAWYVPLENKRPIHSLQMCSAAILAGRRQKAHCFMGVQSPGMGSESPKTLKPRPETEKKMQPLSEAAFDQLLQKASQPQARKPSPKHR